MIYIGINGIDSQFLSVCSIGYFGNIYMEVRFTISCMFLLSYSIGCLGNIYGSSVWYFSCMFLLVCSIGCLGNIDNIYGVPFCFSLYVFVGIFYRMFRQFIQYIWGSSLFFLYVLLVYSIGCLGNIIHTIYMGFLSIFLVCFCWFILLDV